LNKWYSTPEQALDSKLELPNCSKLQGIKKQIKKFSAKAQQFKFINLPRVFTRF